MQVQSLQIPLGIHSHSSWPYKWAGTFLLLHFNDFNGKMLLGALASLKHTGIFPNYEAKDPPQEMVAVWAGRLKKSCDDEETEIWQSPLLFPDPKASWLSPKDPDKQSLTRNTQAAQSSPSSIHLASVHRPQRLTPVHNDTPISSIAVSYMDLIMLNGLPSWPHIGLILRSLFPNKVIFWDSRGLTLQNMNLRDPSQLPTVCIFIKEKNHNSLGEMAQDDGLVRDFA